ncbi:hypothetical protein, partial [Serratia marcescens]|uniref:hypothetical protein n=1 Tax=Serratia marcescens TaxID=615 RepID=UPI0029D7A895
RIDSAFGLTLRATLRVVVSLRDARTSTVLHPSRLGKLCLQEDKVRVGGRRNEKSAKRRFFLNWWVVQDSNLRPID